MGAVLVVLLLGLGLGALGLLDVNMYFVGLIVLFIGAVGLLVWVGDLWRRLYRRPVGAGRDDPAA